MKYITDVIRITEAYDIDFSRTLETSACQQQFQYCSQPNFESKSSQYKLEKHWSNIYSYDK